MSRRPGPLVAAVAMGYGHLRAAHSLAEELATELLLADRPPIAGPAERRLWAASRRVYETTSRLSQLPLVGPALDRVLDTVTAIEPLHPPRDLSAPDRPARVLRRAIERGLGRGLAERVAEAGAPLVTTYFATALAADFHLRRLGDGAPPVFCVGTDSDLARVWAAFDPAACRVRHLAPTRRVARRMAAYGVPPERIELTGFPLPGALLGGEDLVALRRDLAARLARLDPSGALRRGPLRPAIEAALGPAAPGPATAGRPLHVVYSVGGAGAQARLGTRILQALADEIRAGRARLTLVAGTRPEVADRFATAARRAGLETGEPGVEVLHDPDVGAYVARFHRLLAGADLLWTKPSELTFFAALGLPLVLAPPVGEQEHYNLRWALEAGAALPQRDPDHAAHWLAEWLADGTLAATAWNGFTRLPRRGLYRIAARVRGEAGRLEVVSSTGEIDCQTPAEDLARRSRSKVGWTTEMIEVKLDLPDESGVAEEILTPPPRRPRSRPACRGG